MLSAREYRKFGIGMTIVLPACVVYKVILQIHLNAFDVQGVLTAMGLLIPVYLYSLAATYRILLTRDRTEWDRIWNSLKAGIVWAFYAGYSCVISDQFIGFYQSKEIYLIFSEAHLLILILTAFFEGFWFFHIAKKQDRLQEMEDL